MKAAWFAVALLTSAGCTQPIQLVMAPSGTAQAEKDAGAARVARAAASQDDTLGSWSGTGTQSDGLHWPVRVELTAHSGECGIITYPSVPCHGIWVCEGEPGEGGWREAREKIESGHCVDGGRFRYRVRGDSLEWSWSKPSAIRRTDEENLTARGVLTRSDAPGDDEKSKGWVLEEE